MLEALEATFTASHPDLDVRFEVRPDPDVLAALRAGEAAGSVWWGAEWRALATAADEGFLDPYSPPWSEGAEARWAPLYSAPVALVFHTGSVARTRAPRDWIDLMHPRWWDALVLPPVEAEITRAVVEQAMLEELRRTGVESAGEDWLARLDAVAAAYAPDPAEQIRRLRAGEASMTLLPAHTAQALSGQYDWLAARFMESGGPVVVRGVAILARPDGAPSAGAAARAFVDHLGQPEALRAVQQHLGWGPAFRMAGVDRDGGWPSVGSGAPVWDFAPDTLAARGPGWYSHWRQDIQGRGRAR
ncbi:MAG: substrate-binding domain-containing protein [Longimicrobiales bacterium]